MAVFVATTTLGVISAAAQIAGPRDASIKDLIADCLKAAAAILLAVAIDERTLLGLRRRLGLTLAGSVRLLIAFWPLINVSSAYMERNSQRPVLLSFETRHRNTFWRTQHSSLKVELDETTGRKSGILTFDQGAWPGLIIHDIWPDWRGYSTFVVELWVDDDQPLGVNVRVHDREHQQGNQPYRDRFNQFFELEFGRHTLRIPLERIRSAPAGRDMNMSKIDGIVLFCSAGNAGRKVQLFELRLEY